MIKASVNTFIGGWNVDIDKSILPKNKYLGAVNYRLITTEGGTTGSFENIKGTKFILNTTPIIGTNVVDGYIVGSCQLRDDIILFVTKNTGSAPSGGESRIYRQQINLTSETHTSLTLLYDDTLNSDGSSLNFSTHYPIKAIAKYETPNVQKIYWTDGYNNIRHANVATNLTVGGGAYVAAGDYMSIDKFEFLPKFIVTKPTLQDIVSGRVNTGMIAYSYQLYKINGAETAFSPLSDPIHVVSDSDFSTDTRLYKGDKEAVNSGKGFLINIDNTENVGYNRLRLIRVQYSYINSVPEIFIANEIEIDPFGSTIQIVDTGDDIGELTVDEFNVVSTELFKCQDIASKDNRLFVANIKKSDFIDDETVLAWDARAVRFKTATAAGSGTVTTNGTEALVGSGTYFTHSKVGYTITVSGETIRTIATITDDTHLTVTVAFSTTASGLSYTIETTKATIQDNGQGSRTILSNLSNWTDYSVDHDGINLFNNPTNDGNALYQWKYQANGTTIGAEGLNVKIDFKTEYVHLDTSGNNATFHTYSPSSNSDKSYKNYASPWKNGKLSWQRDEVYRLFVVFGNDRGQLADPKWICDLKMPSLHDEDFTNSSGSTVKSSVLSELVSSALINTHRLYPRIYFKSFPASATYAQIYRVKRERPDRSVVTQGFAVPSFLATSTYYPYEAKIALPNNGEIFKLVSPEINITKNISKQGNDYIEYVTRYSNSSIANVKGTKSAAFNFGGVIKMKQNERVPFTAATVAVIDDAFPVSPAITNSSDIVSIDSKFYSNYNNSDVIQSKGCTGLIIAYSPSTWSAETLTNVIVNYRANVFNSQYGGNTYEDRMANISIPCSNVITNADVNMFWVDISYGDTFINYFEVSTLLADLSKDTYDKTWCETVYVPLESSINCDLRYDAEATHLFPLPITYSDYIPFFRQEYAGEHTMKMYAHDYTLHQTKNLYLYNTVYSQQIDLQAAISLVVDKIMETEFDSMVKVSNNKSSGEITDSWTKFGVNEFIEVDSIYGPINTIKNFNDKLFYFQDKAFGLFAVNDRSLIQDSSSAQLVLGTGGVLDRYDYASTIIGCRDKFSVVNGTTGLFWYDRLNNFIIKYSDNIDKISLSKGIQSYINNNVLTTQSVIAHPDINNSEILFTFFIGGTGADDDAFTIAYSENIDAFVSSYSFIPNIYIPYHNRYLTTTRAKYCNNQFALNYLFLHDSDIYPRCNFYALTNNNVNYYFDSTLKLLYNEDYLYTKAWDNISYMSNVYNSSGVELYNQTLDSIRCYNDYQNTDYVNLVYDTNLKRRERSWTLDVPRNLVDVVTTTNPDIFAAANLLNPTRTFRERLRDKYMVVDLVYKNQVGRDKFVLSNVGVRYRFSYR